MFPGAILKLKTMVASRTLVSMTLVTELIIIWGRCFLHQQPHSPSFSIGIVKTASHFIVRSVETG